MGRFLAFVLVFLLGGIIGLGVGGLFGGVAGAYVGACEVIDLSVSGGTMTQDQANALMRSLADDLDIQPGRKQQIIDSLKKADQPPSPCATAIQAL
jgi:hypothetical protein